MISLTSPVRTRAHDWPAGAKLGGLCVATMALFAINGLLGQGIALMGVLLLYCLPGVSFLRSGVRALWILWPFVVIVAIWHGFDGSFADGMVIILRMVTAVALANLVTMTTRLTDMIAALRWMLAPLRAVGISTRAIEIAIALVIRMTPVIMEHAQALVLSWNARSAKRPNWRIVMPLMVSVFDDADHVADALRARGGLIDNPADDPKQGML